MEYENFSFVEAVKALAERAGVELPSLEYSREAKEQADLRSALLDINRQAARYYYYQLRQPVGKAGDGLPERASALGGDHPPVWAGLFGPLSATICTGI